MNFVCLLTLFVTIIFLVVSAIAANLPAEDALHIWKNENWMIMVNEDSSGHYSALATKSLKDSNFCLNEHNAARQANGMPPLSYSTQLEAASQNHNNFMVDQNCFSHQCSGEADFSDRISQAGYRWSGIGENIAAGYTNCHSAVEGWMNSDGHRRNILGDFQHVGCAMRECSHCSYGQYWTCDFGNPA